MKYTYLKYAALPAAVLALWVSPTSAQWNGSSGVNATIARNGSVGIGFTNGNTNNVNAKLDVNGNAILRSKVTIGTNTTGTENLNINGGAVFGQATTSRPAGTVEWDGSNFRGWDGSQWLNLDASGTITQTDINNWNSAFGWGDHSIAGYMTTAAFNATPAAGITNGQITNWNTAFGWGNHATAGYHTITAFNATPAGGITSTDVGNWNTAFGWGDHNAAGYHTITAFNATPAGGITSTDVSNWNLAFSWGDHATAGYVPGTAGFGTLNRIPYLSGLGGWADGSISDFGAGQIAIRPLAINITPAVELDVLGSALFTGAGTAIPAVLGTNNFMFFDGTTGAFRAGTASTNQFDTAFVGTNSIGLGTDVIAPGFNSVAIGQNVAATAANSVVIGQGVIAGTPLNNPIASSFMVSFAGTGGTPGLYVGPPTAPTLPSTVEAVGIGTSAPSFTLDVVGDAGKTSGGANWNTISDARLKNVESSVDNGLELIDQLHPVRYTWNEKRNEMFGEDRPGIKYGFLAQEIKEVIPEFVIVGETEDDILMYNPSGFEAIFTSAIQQLHRDLESLEQGSPEELITAIEALEGENVALKEELASIAAQMEDLHDLLNALCEDGCGQYSPTGMLNPSMDGHVQSTLFQNAPNPFNTTTTIRYFIAEEVGQASLFIYNLQGEQLKSIDLIERGNGSIELNANALKAGQYFYSLIVEGQEIDTKKMIITK